MDRKRVDVYSESSERQGLGWLLEVFLRKFRTFAFLVFAAPVYLLAASCLGLALVPGLWLIHSVYTYMIHEPLYLLLPALGISIGCAYFLYGLSLIFIVAIVNLPFKPFVRPFRGNWFSLQSVPWFVHNGLTYMVRYTFLEFVTPTPINLMFYRLMGMKIGKGTMINTTNVSDPCLISLGDHVTIGGSAHLMAHYGQKGYLVLAPVRIGNRVTVGLKASIMGDVVVGDGAVIAPHAVLMPKTRVEALKTFSASGDQT